jgi:serpin B
VFTDRNGNKQKIDFMQKTGYFDFYRDSSIKIVYLPYKDKRLGMYIALTDDAPTDFEKYIDKLECKKVRLTIPKFEAEFSINATQLMVHLGINNAFDANSQTPHFVSMFNDAINNKMNVFMEKIIQKAYISVAEEGTEAGVVTMLVAMPGSCQPTFEEIFEFKANKPFTYFIRDNVTGEILFMGEYAYSEN